jgi:hypothetical protein
MAGTQPGGRLPLLPTRIETYRVTPKLGRAVDEAATEFEKSLARLRVEMNLHVEFDKDTGFSPSKRQLAGPRLRRQISAKAMPTPIDLRFRDTFMQPSINRAWENLWDALGDCCLPKNRIRATIKYPIDPRKYAVWLGGREE